MLRNGLRFLALMTALSPAALRAEPVTLKLSLFTSDRSSVYQCDVMPFVDAVNAAGTGLVEIKVSFSSTISPTIADQPRLVREGVADLAIIVPGTAPQAFPDTSVLQLPGLYRDEDEASLVFIRLVEEGLLEDYRPFEVIGALVSEAESIHSRKPLADLADLKGLKIRVNNLVESRILQRLAAKPAVLPINRASDGLSDGSIDAVTAPPWLLFEFGLGRLTSHHYLVALGGTPVALVMNREKFAALPEPVRDVIHQFGGRWYADRSHACAAAKGREALAQLRANTRRAVTEPSPSDVARLRDVYSSVVSEWAAESPHNGELFAHVTAELAKLRKESPR